MSDPVHGGLLTVVDYAAIAILLGSMLLGMLRGLVRELFNLVGWVVAFFVARAFGPSVAHWLPADLPGGEMTQGAIGFLLVLVAVVFGAGIVSALVGRMTDLIGLRPADRGLGMVFGIVRGMLLLMLLMVAAKLTSLPQQPVWQQSLVRPWVEVGLSRLMPYLPEPVQHYLHNPEAAVPSVNPLGTPIPLPQLAPYRGTPDAGGQGAQGSTRHSDGERAKGTSGAAESSGTSAPMGGGAVRGDSGGSSSGSLGTGLTGDGLSGQGALGQSQGWGMRVGGAGGAGGAGGSVTPSTGLHKVSE
ncbi:MULTISPECIES: CvpA family protein [Pandoraea]|uniref:Colicin v production transmembrane protein n=1 Tax=Pandoraea cepalis TaxID=2508294 RepID=A0A5E4UZM7_9BURK|nr:MULTISPECIES: CvpA family protein [Pandoraea]VVE04020.1 colicin v production transmembrane protein [Pandoraea cepalis]